MEKVIILNKKKTPERLFNEAISVCEQKYTKEHKPFDRACARLDYYFEIDRLKKEIELSEGGIDHNDSRFNLPYPKFEDYAKMDRFEKLGESEDNQEKKVNGMVENIVIGKTEFYVCKQRGHKIGVHVPLTKNN